MAFFNGFNPRAAIADFIAFTRNAEREHVIGITLAVLVTSVILVIFTVDARVNTSPGRSVTYVELFESDRTDEEIIARQEREQAEIEERARARQEEFRQIDEALERAGI